MYYYYPQFTDKETKMQRGHMVSKWWRKNLNPRSLMTVVMSQQRRWLPGRCVDRYAVASSPVENSQSFVKQSGPSQAGRVICRFNKLYHKSHQRVKFTAHLCPCDWMHFSKMGKIILFTPHVLLIMWLWHPSLWEVVSVSSTWIYERLWLQWK